MSTRFRVDQPYRLVFFGEKTSLEDVLSPVARDCGADLYLPAGEISDTMLYQMAQAGADGRPADGGVRASADCDPSGLADADLDRRASCRRSRRCCSPSLEFQVAGSR